MTATQEVHTSDADLDTPPTSTRAARGTRPEKKSGTDWSAVAGIAFAPLFIAAVATSVFGVPETAAPMTEWVDWATDDSNGTIAIGSVYVAFLAALAFIVFTTGLARRIRAESGRSSLGADLVYGLGLLTGAFFTAAGVAWNNGPIPYVIDGQLPDPSDIHIFVQIQSVGFGFVMVGMALAVATIIAIASASLRRSMPSWFTIAGYIAAIALLGALAFIPLMAIPLWTLIAGVLMLRQPARAEA